jgi:hypothetical protein
MISKGSAMAVTGTKDDNNQQQSAPGGAPNPEQTQFKAPGFDSSKGLGGFGGLINTYGQNQSLGTAIDEYIKNIKGYFGNDVATTGGIKIDVHRLNNPRGAHAFVSGEHALLMLFSDLLMADTQNFLPVSDWAPNAAAALRERLGGNIKIINTVVVIPQDYTRAQQQARYINESLMTVVRPGLHSANISELADWQYSIDPDVLAARNFINDRNPSSVMPRTDIGFVVYAKPPRRQGQMVGPMDEMTAVAAVGGYTEILSTPVAGNQIKYAPIVHITSVVSIVPVPGLVSLALAIAADQFIGSGRWISQFSSYQRGKPNLGNLFPDPQDPKKMWNIQSDADLNNLRNAYFLPAMLAIDVADGTARIPALADYGYVANSGKVYDQIQNFFGMRLQLDRTQQPYTLQPSDFIGVYGDPSGNLVDSRNIDYMTLLASGGTQDPSTSMLLGYPLNAADRARVVYDKTGGSFRSLYRNTTSVLNPQLLGILARAVVDSLGIEPPRGQSRMSSQQWLEAVGQLYLTQNFSVTRAGSGPSFAGGGLYQV